MTFDRDERVAARGEGDVVLVAPDERGLERLIPRAMDAYERATRRDHAVTVGGEGDGVHALGLGCKRRLGAAVDHAKDAHGAVDPTRGVVVMTEAGGDARAARIDGDGMGARLRVEQAYRAREAHVEVVHDERVLARMASVGPLEEAAMSIGRRMSMVRS